MTTEKSAGELSRIELAGFVAQRVQIDTVRMVSGSFSQSALLTVAKKPEIQLQTRAVPTVDPTNNRITIAAHFRLSGMYAGTNDPVLDVQADFEMSYSVPTFDGIEPHHIKAFGELNGLYNGWPYWREYVQSSLARMGLPQLTLPIYRPSASDYQKPALPAPAEWTALLAAPAPEYPPESKPKKKASRKKKATK